MSKRWILVTALAAALGLTGGYLVADAADIVPGWITDSPLPPSPEPFPDVAAVVAVEAPGVVKGADPDAAMPSAEAVAALAARLRDDPRMGTSTGISVVDIETGEVLAAVRADDPQVPASNVKVLTAVATLDALGPDRPLRTSLMWSGAPEADGTAVITLVAGGDVLLAAERGHGSIVGGANAYAGLADLADLAVTALADAGVTKVALRVDDHAFVGPGINPRWPWYAIGQGYVAPATGLAVDAGALTDEPYPPRHSDPSIQAAGVLSARLMERGIDVSSQARGIAPNGAVELAGVDSAPMWLVLRHMLLASDNTVAEQLVMVLALESGRVGSVAQGSAEVLSRLEALGVDTTGVRLDDGSGFSASNRISPEVLTALIVTLAGDPQLDDLLEWLPIASLRGTLHDRFVGTEGAGTVRAKTGSLSGVTSLSGTIVTVDGRWIAFSVLADGMATGQEKPRAAVDEFIAALAACGCG